MSSDIIFFLGSGASVFAGIPAVQPMTEDFVKEVHAKHKDLKHALDSTMEHLSKSWTRLKREGSPDVEALLEMLDTLLTLDEKPLSDFVRPSHGLPAAELQKLKKVLESFIRRAVMSPKQVDYLSPLIDIQTWGDPIDIFSVNYDPCIELLCRRHQRRLIDGFNPEWNPKELERTDEDQGKGAVYLYKLHGSVLWYKAKKTGWFVKVPIRPDDDGNSAKDLSLYDGEPAEPILLYPMYKQPNDAPLLDFTYLLKKRLETARFVIVIGYSFRDQYLNALFRDAFLSRRNLHMIVIAPDARQRYEGLLSTSPAYNTAFKHRVTCYPHTVESFLQRFTFDFFGSLSNHISAWQTHEHTAATGRNLNWSDVVVPLSQAREAELSHMAMERSQMAYRLNPREVLGSRLRNAATAIALKDADLREKTSKAFGATLRRAWHHCHFVLNAGGEVMPKFYERDNSGFNNLSPQTFSDILKEGRAFIDALTSDMLSKDTQAIRQLQEMSQYCAKAQDWFDAFGSQDRYDPKTLAAILMKQMPGTKKALEAWAAKVAAMSSEERTRSSHFLTTVTEEVPSCLAALGA